MFCGKMGTSISEKPWFLTENIDFLTKTHFLALSSYNNAIKAYEERILVQIFTLIPNPGSKTMFWLLKKGQKFQKIVFILRILTLAENTPFFETFELFSKVKHSYWARIHNQRKHLSRNASFIRFYNVVEAKQCQKMSFWLKNQYFRSKITVFQKLRFPICHKTSSYE